MSQRPPHPQHSPRTSRLGINLLRIATLYLVAGLALGIWMGMSGDFAFSPVHSHVLLIGWATLAITGLAYLSLPACAESQLARLHFWGHNAGLPVMATAWRCSRPDIRQARP